MRLNLLLPTLAAAAFSLGAFAAAPAAAQVPAVVPASPAPDYRTDDVWLCRPGKMALCTTGLEALRIDGSGAPKAEGFTPAADPKVDCFYVYPTVSRDTTPLSDLNAGPEEFGVVKAQFARFAARCRVFAPLYRQVTLAALGSGRSGGGEIDWSPAYKDVLAAWKDYLARDNHGRGVLLVGHSQGSILLSRLIAEEIEGRPVQKQVIAAYLAGHPQITVPLNGEVGGTFKTTPLCRSASQTGCVIAWSSYDASAMPATRIFERAPDPGLSSVCVNPAALAGGKAPLDAYLSKPRDAPEGSPPFVHDVGGFTGECISDEKGSVLAVSVVPGAPGAALRQTLLTAVTGRSPTWGLHGLDVSLTEGSLLTLADSQIAAYLAKGR